MLAAELAQLGFSGPTQIYEFADGGVLKAFSDASDPAPLTEELGAVYPSRQNFNQTVLRAAAARTPTSTPRSRCARSSAHRGTRVAPCVSAPANVVDVQCGFDYTPSSALNAQMSLRYTIAVALLDGQVLPAQFTDAKLADPAIVALAERH